MAFTGQENHAISLSEAAQLTARFRSGAPTGAILGGFIGKEAIQGVLNQEGCVGIKYYYAEKDDGSPTLVVTGVNKDEDDLDQGELLEFTFPCPPFCGAANSLNS